MRFSIITPSFRNSTWLKLCIASVADQAGVDLEHIVQDSCSDDGTQDWLPQDPRVKAFIEKDGGMYDAVNRGYRRATGDILAYLNCDEQYLPGALKTVHDFFAAHPKVEVLLAGSIVTDGEGKYVCHRHALTPHPQGVWFRFMVLTSSLFIRRKVIHERGIFFDMNWRDLGDFHWMLALMKHRVPMAVLRPVHIRLCGHRREHEPQAERGPGKGGDRRHDSPLGQNHPTALDSEPSPVPAAGGAFQLGTHPLLHLHPGQPRPARHR